MAKEASWPGWEVGACIGKGGHGAVYELRREVFGDVERSALKVIRVPTDPGEIEYLRCEGMDDESISNTFYSKVGDIVKEYKLMRKFRDNPNIVHCDEFRYTRHEEDLGWDVLIKMELLTPLTKALDRVSDEKQIIALGMDMCNALIACQEAKIIHRDIKPQNIFLAPSGAFKLGDFGIARTMEHTTRATVGIGTYSFMAPEVARGDAYGPTVDIYSLGLVMYWLLNEKRGPFLPLPPTAITYAMNDEARIRRYKGEKLPPPKNGSEELKRIVLKACSFNPRNRYASAKLLMGDLQKLSAQSSTQGEPGNGTTASGGGNTVNVSPPPPPPPKDFPLKVFLVAICCVITVAYFAIYAMNIGKGNDDPIDPSALATEAVSTASDINTASSDDTETVHTHTWAEATYSIPQRCTTCGLLQGSAIGSPISAGFYYTTVIKSDGTVIVPNKQIDVSELSNIVSVSANSSGGGTYAIALREDGTAVIAFPGLDQSSTNYDYDSLDVTGWRDLVAVAAGDRHAVGLKSDGTVVAVGSNEQGQCNVSSWTNIVAVAAGGNHTVGLKADGTVVAVGLNDDGQCDVSGWKNITALSAGYHYTAGLKTDGTVLTAGFSEPESVSQWKNIATISAGAYHLVGLKTDGTVVAAGSTGSGRCNVSKWEDMVAVSAGFIHTAGLCADGTVIVVGESPDYNDVYNQEIDVRMS